MKNMTVYKGDDSAFSQTQKTIKLKTNITDFNGWSGSCILGATGYRQSVSAAELTQGSIYLRFTAADTMSWPEGFHEIVLKLRDPDGKEKSFLCDTIFEVRSEK